MIEFIEYLEIIDRQLFLFINGLHSPAFDWLMMAFSDARFWAPLYLWLLFALFKAYPGKQMLLVLLAVGLSITFTDRLSVEAFKEVFQRYRPCYNADIKAIIHLVKDSCGGQYGFVSSHAANFAGLGMLFTRLLKFEYKNIGWVLAVWVGIIGYSRIYIGVHYPADVIGGIILGSIIGWLIYKGFAKLIE